MQQTMLALNLAHKAGLCGSALAGLDVPARPGVSTGRQKLPATIPAQAWHSVQLLPEALGWSRAEAAPGLPLSPSPLGTVVVLTKSHLPWLVPWVFLTGSRAPTTPCREHRYPGLQGNRAPGTSSTKLTELHSGRGLQLHHCNPPSSPTHTPP